MLTIVLSGPKTSLPQAKTALASMGYTVTDTDRTHGLEDLSKPREPHAFVTCEGEDVDRAYLAVGPLGWQLRAHYHAVEQVPAEVDFVARLVALEERVRLLEDLI